jgi:hypothetical protein
MSRLNTCALILSAFFAGLILEAQNSGRFEEAKRMGLAYINSGQFDKAAGRLEEVWEQDQSDASVGENLALAYLNTENRHSLPGMQKQAFAIIENLVAMNRPVSFMVQHSHEKLSWLQGREWHQYCSGRLTITGNLLSYMADKGKDASAHAFEEPLHGLPKNAIELNDSGTGVFHLKTPKGGYVMSVRNRNGEEATFLVALVKQRLNRLEP